MVVGELTVETDLVILGGGPGGCAAALRAAELGMQATIVDERAGPGGAWLHDGCMVAWELLGIANTVRRAAGLASCGIGLGEIEIKMDALRDACRRAQEECGESLRSRLDETGIQIVRGRARFDNSRQLTILDNTTVPRIRFRRAIIATGSRDIPLGLDVEGADGETPKSLGVLHAAEALDLPDRCIRVLVIGGSTIALELATIHAALGHRVTLVDPSTRLVPLADEDLVGPLRESLARTIDDLRLDTTVTRIIASEGRLEAELTGHGDAGTHTFDRVLVARGRRPDVSDLGLARTGVRADENGCLTVNEQLQTTDPRILAVGDVTGEPMLTTKATHQGRIAAEVAADWGSVYDSRAVPRAIFTDPQLAWCGLTAAQAADRELPFEVLTDRRDSGLHEVRTFVKIIYERDTQLVLGIGIVGPDAAELISQGALAIEMGAVLTDLANVMHPHPTRSSLIGEAARRAGEQAE